MLWAYERTKGFFVALHHLANRSFDKVALELVCTECGQPVRQDRITGFAHYSSRKRKNEEKVTRSCSLLNNKHGHFAKALTSSTLSVPREYGDRQNEEVRAILTRPDVRDFNLSLLSSFYNAVTGYTLSPQRRDDWYNSAVGRHGYAPLLATHFYWLPYLKVMESQTLVRKGYGADYDVQLQENGMRYVLYKDCLGGLHQAAVPARLVLIRSFSAGRGSSYELTPEQASRLAGRPPPSVHPQFVGEVALRWPIQVMARKERVLKLPGLS